MRMTILSHAGLLVEAQNRQLICDPWLVGSCYWRSWWNYPPVSPELISRLKPDWIYLTHIHWDHFQSASLKLFAPDTPIMIPFDRHTRMCDDLRRIGARHIVELRHGQRHKLTPNLAVTAYQFSPFSDSALVIEADGITILNANDAKFIGLPLAQILHRHKRIDFALRSHSSANARLTYHCLDAPEEVQDNVEGYSRAFCAFMMRVKPRYAIPFASSHCYLHRNTWEFNRYIVSPDAVAREFSAYQHEHPFATELKVMTSGDSWSNETGFNIRPVPWLADREASLRAYAAVKSPVLERTYAREAEVRISDDLVRRHLLAFVDAIPLLVRRYFRGHAVLFDAWAGDTRRGFILDLWCRSVTPVDPATTDPTMMRVSMPLHVFKAALTLRMFGHAGISKHPRWYATRADMWRLHLVEGLLSWYEAEAIPLSRLLRWRFFVCYARRWREVLLYFQLIAGVLRGKSLRQQEEELLTPGVHPCLDQQT